MCSRSAILHASPMLRNNLISPIAYHQPISNPLVATDADRHRHIRELEADGAGMRASVLGPYEGCGTKPGAHLRLQTPSIARHSNQTHCTRALILFLRCPMCFVPCTLCRFSQHRTMCRRSLELSTVSATRLLAIYCMP